MLTSASLFALMMAPALAILAISLLVGLFEKKSL